MELSIQRDRLASLLQAASGRRIIIVGDAMLDVYLRGEVERISPEAPVPVVRVRERRSALGGAANVAGNVAALDARPHLVAVVGDDPAGANLRAMLLHAGADDGSILTVGRPTTTKTRVLARVQQVVRFDEEEDTALPAEVEERVIDAVHAVLGHADALVLEDYNKGLLTSRIIGETMAAARSRNIPVVVDPKYRNFFCYRGATVFKPNRRELESALGAGIDLEHPEALPATLDRLGVDHILLTLGEHGMVLVSAGGEVARVPTAAREVYDVVGAGDTVTAYLATMLAAGATVAEAAVVANLAAGVEVGKLGAATVSADEVLAAQDWLTEANSR